MPTMCIHCAMRAIVAGTVPPIFEESPEEHLLRCHPDPAETFIERCELLDKLAAMSEEDFNPTDPSKEKPKP